MQLEQPRKRYEGTANVSYTFSGLILPVVVLQLLEMWLKQIPVHAVGRDLYNYARCKCCNQRVDAILDAAPGRWCDADWCIIHDENLKCRTFLEEVGAAARALAAALVGQVAMVELQPSVIT